jgi:hypothetical protein
VVQLGDGYTWGLVNPWGTVSAIHGEVFDTEDEAYEHLHQTFKALTHSKGDGSMSL